MVQTMKFHLVNELRFPDFVSGLSYCIIIWTAFPAERTADLKGLQKIIDFFVFEFTTTIGMKPLQLSQITLNRGKSTRDQCSILVWACTITDDFSIKQVEKYANIMPLVFNLHIG